LLIDSTTWGYEQAIWGGIVEQARDFGANLITFNVSRPDMEGRNRVLNRLVELINENNLQGLINCASTILDILPKKELNAFCNSFRPLPMVNISVEVPGIPSLTVDNYKGMRAIIDHLIEEHGRRRLVYLQIGSDSPEFAERFRAYRESLADHNIPFDPELVVPGEYFGLSEETAALLFDEKKIDCDALVFVNDDIALRMIPVLKARGFQIPEDISITGFDNQEISRFSSPPLTTVRQPLRDLGRESVNLLIKQIRGEEVPAIVNLPTEIMIRQSCGCAQIGEASSSVYELDGEIEINGIPGLETIKDEIISNIIEATQMPENRKHIIDKILDAYFEALTQKSFEVFLNTLAQIAEATPNIADHLQTVITVIRGYALWAIQDPETRFLAEDFHHRARMLAADIAEREQAHLRLDAMAGINALRSFGERLAGTANRDRLFDLLAQHLPEQGVPSGLLILNEQLQSEAKYQQLLLAFNAEKRFEIPNEGLFIERGNFPPAEYFPTKQPYSFVAEPIDIRDQENGYILFEAGSSNGALYYSLADQIGSALGNIILIEQVDNRAKQLSAAAEISRAASNILDPKELIAKAVDLIKEHFELYYVGLFLADSERKWAELRAGTGEAGTNMLAENWRLEIGGDSMIGNCITTNKADIQLDVDKAPVHLRNPHLPKTKSEMALPLVSRGAVMGALTIQSVEPNAFSQEDVAILQTMADQIATSIANARLFERTQTALLDTETLLNISRMAGTTVEFEAYTKRVLDITLKSTGIEAGLFSIFNPETNQLEITAHQIPEALLVPLQENGLEGSLCDLVYKQKDSLIVPDLADNSPIDTTGLVELGFNAYQGVPLTTKGQVYGTLCTFSQAKLHQEESSIALLQAIGQQVAVAIQNTRLFEQTQNALAETERQAKRLTALNQLSEKLGQIETLEEIYHISTSTLADMVQADRAGLALVTSNGQHAEFLAISSAEDQVTATMNAIPLTGSHLGLAIQTKKAKIVTNASQITSQEQSFAGINIESLLVVPLMVGGEVIGAFSVGSKMHNYFSEIDIDLGVQLASIIGNAIENHNLIQQSQAALSELEATQRRYQIQAWSSYNQTRSASGYQRTPLGVEPIGRRATPETKKALEEKTPLVSEASDNLKLTIPIMLRDQPIGAIGLQAQEGKRQWSPDEIALAQEIGEQFALAAESLRLLDETQRRAARERLVAEITTKIRASTDPQTMLQTAAQELQNALKSKRTQVLLRGNSQKGNDQGNVEGGE
jgi:GAF domain-containing protein/DNA-binding LacI/PurR family transcriptional regulator